MTTLREAPVAVYGGWQVYADSIRHDGASYDLTRGELERQGADWWDAHMAAKRWCNVDEFRAARARLLGEGTR